MEEGREDEHACGMNVRGREPHTWHIMGWPTAPQQWRGRAQAGSGGRQASHHPLPLRLRLLTHSLPFSSVCHHHELQLPQTRLLAALLRDSKRGTWELQEISEFLQLFCPVY